MVKKFLDHTTPSARTNEASRLFLIVQPPLLLLRRGVRQPQSTTGIDRLEPLPRLGLSSNLIRFSDWTAGAFQPFPLTRIHMGRKLAVDLFVVSIEPGAFLRYQKLGIYQAGVDRAKCESLKLVIRHAVFTREPVSSGCFLDENKILESNPILSRLVVARLIAEDVARFDREPGVLRRTDAARTFVYIQKRTHAVPGPVVVIQSDVPEGGPGQRVQSSTGDAARKANSAQSNVSLQHTRKAVSLFCAGFLSQQHGAGYIRCAVEILSSGIDEIDPGGTNANVGFGRHRVMDDRPMRGISRDRRKAESTEVLPCPAKLFELVRRGDLGDFLFAYRILEPAEESGTSPRRLEGARRAYPESQFCFSGLSSA